MLFYKLINNFFDLEESLSSIVINLALRHMNVTLGRDVMFVGRPYISLYPGSIISIGDNCMLRSRYRNNAIGINHRIILRTQSKHAELIIGEHVGISGGAICAKNSIKIGSYCLIGSNVVIADNDFHPVNPENRRYNRNDEDIPAKPITIERNVWIGADSYVLKGVTIGENSVIGARSLISKDIPPNCIAAGNPAKVVRVLGGTL